MNPLDHMVQFIRKHGTPKLKACSADVLEQWLLDQGTKGHMVYEPGLAMLIGWPCHPAYPTESRACGNAVYISNLCRAPGTKGRQALARVIQQARLRWPKTTWFIGHRVPKQQRNNPRAVGVAVHYHLLPNRDLARRLIAGKESA